MTRQKPRRELFECPNCGADVPVGRKACPACGSDEQTGWQSGEEIEYRGLDLPQGYAIDPEHPGSVVERRRPGLVVVLLVLLTVVGLALWALLR